MSVPRPYEVHSEHHGTGSQVKEVSGSCENRALLSLTGFEYCNQVRTSISQGVAQKPETSQPPTILVSSSKNVEDEFQSLQTHPDHCFENSSSTSISTRSARTIGTDLSLRRLLSFSRYTDSCSSLSQNSGSSTFAMFAQFFGCRMGASVRALSPYFFMSTSRCLPVPHLFRSLFGSFLATIVHVLLSFRYYKRFRMFSRNSFTLRVFRYSIGCASRLSNAIISLRYVDSTHSSSVDLSSPGSHIV